MSLGQSSALSANPTAKTVSRAQALRALLGLGCVALAAWCAHSFFLASWLYNDYWQPSIDDTGIPRLELSFDLLYLFYGTAFLALFALGLSLAGASQPLGERLRAAGRSRLLPALLVGIAVTTALAVRNLLLRHQAITDDEEVYLFIARTLLGGRVTNPLPAQPEFFQNQFIVLGEHGWFGKYPIGHGVVLAIGLLTHTTELILPLMAGVTTWLTWFVTERTMGRGRAALATALVALSPHFTWTHATLLSQPTSCLLLMAALACLVTWRARRRPGWLLGAGGALAFGIIVRPMPGALFVAGAALTVVWPLRRSPSQAMRALLWLGLPVIAGVVILALVNLAQSGSLLRSGYHEVHKTLGVVGGRKGAIGLSVFGAILRENFWLFGWPLSLLPILASKPRRSGLLLWCPVLSALAYRVLVPKTVVSTTGPTYMMEVVPILAILSADGLMRARALLTSWRGKRVGAQVGVWVALAFLTALVFFVPVEAASVVQGARSRAAVFELLEQAKVERAVVFTNNLVPTRSGLSWAYFAPNPSPRLDDDILFLRLPHDPSGRDRAVALWRSQFSDRPAFVFESVPEPKLEPLVPAPPPH